MDENLEKLKQLIIDYETNKNTIETTYLEAQIKQEYIDAFFKLLGWDVTNEGKKSPEYREVILESKVKEDEHSGRADYCFIYWREKLFYVEAKRPSSSIKNSKYSYQIRRYAWTLESFNIGILTNFRELAIYKVSNCPKEKDDYTIDRVKYFTLNDYVRQWEWLKDIFSKNAVKKGKFRKFVEYHKKEKGDKAIDEAFLQYIEGWRLKISQSLIQNIEEKDLEKYKLTHFVQKIINALIFLRVCEDRGIEEYGALKTLGNKPNVTLNFYKHCEKVERKYNSGFLCFKEENQETNERLDDLTHTLGVNDHLLKDIISSLYYPDCPYAFDVLGASFFAIVYEIFLGKTLETKGSHQVKVIDKPETKEQDGVYYTPQYIVQYITERTVKAFCEEKTPGDISKLRVIDIACGSGIFIIEAFTALLDWHLKYYRENEMVEQIKARKILEAKNGEIVLSFKEKRRILKNNIFGVDKDILAVEVTKLALFLKLLHGETQETLEEQLSFSPKNILPDITNNIKCGNSLLGTNSISPKDCSFENDQLFDWGAEYPTIMNKEGGFDIVIGNPPYFPQKLLKDDKQMFHLLQTEYETYQEVIDMYAYFIERGHVLLKEGGHLCYIVSNKWMKTASGKSLRKWLKSRKILEIVDFSKFSVFEGVSIHSCILHVEKSIEAEGYLNFYRIQNKDDLNLRNLLRKVDRYSERVKKNDLENGFFNY